MGLSHFSEDRRSLVTFVNSRHFVVREDLQTASALQAAEGFMKDGLEAAGQESAISKINARLMTLDAEVERLADAIAQIGFSDVLARRLKAAETESSELRREIAATVRSASLDPKSVLREYQERVTKLGACSIKRLPRAYPSATRRPIGSYPLG